MPIYAYRCERCGHAKDVLQKLSDPVLTVCPACGEPAFRKQLTAAGFQLKGSGWYVTDFRGGQGAKPAAEGESGKGDSGKGDSGTGEAAKPGSGTSEATAASPSPAAAPAAPAASSSSPPASGSGSSSTG